MLSATGLDVRAGARTLLRGVTFHISAGDRIGLIGRNGAGKTTLLRMLAGELLPTAGSITTTGPVGYLPQDSRAADDTATVTERILSARGLDRAMQELHRAESAMAHAIDDADQQRAMRAYSRAEDEFQARGGHLAEAEAARIAAGIGLPERVLHQQVSILSGGQRRRVELARMLFSDCDTLLLDEPTNHLDADSIVWLRGFLAKHAGGILLISHDTGLLAEVVNRVFHIDSHRATMDIYNTGWRTYRADRDADERRHVRERANAERKAARLRAQAEKMRSHVATAVAAKNMARRADRMLLETEPSRPAEKVARMRLPEPAPCGRVPLFVEELAKSYGEVPVFDGVDLSVDRGGRVVVLGLNGTGKTTLLRILAGLEAPERGRVVPGHGLRIGYFAQEHENLCPSETVRENLAAAAPALTQGEIRSVLGSFLFTGDEADKRVEVLSGGEKTRLALACLVHSGANVLLLDEPTNNLDPVSHDEVLRAISVYRGAIVLVTHDDGAVKALNPHRVLLLPDGTEDLWTDEYEGLISLA